MEKQEDLRVMVHWLCFCGADDVDFSTGDKNFVAKMQKKLDRGVSLVLILWQDLLIFFKKKLDMGKVVFYNQKNVTSFKEKGVISENVLDF